MGSKSPLVILVIGIIGFGAMGFMVKYSFESVPGLRKIAEVKQALAQGFGDRDLRQLSVRQEKSQNVVVRMTLGELRDDDASVLADEVAQLFVDRFRGKRKRNITVVLAREAFFGWGEDEVFQQDYSVPELLAERNFRVKLTRLDDMDVPRSSIRIHRGVYVSMVEVRVELVPIPGQSFDREHLATHFRTLKQSIEKSLRGSAVRHLVLVLRSEPGAEIQEEIQIDRTASKLPEDKSGVPSGGKSARNLGTNAAENAAPAAQRP